jgi:hypothetical protein
MPATFDEYGVRFMYPDNWEITERTGGEESVGVTLESPDGAFFSLNRYHRQNAPESLKEQVIGAMRAEYEEIEVVPDPHSVPSQGEAGCELNFFVLDLLVTARILIIPDRQDLLLLQIQAENRQFDKQERVFEAMLKTLRDHLGEADASA